MTQADDPNNGFLPFLGSQGSEEDRDLTDLFGGIKNPSTGMKVRVIQLTPTAEIVAPSHTIKRRHLGIEGVLCSPVPTGPLDVWWVRHYGAGNSMAPYRLCELEETP